MAMINLRNITKKYGDKTVYENFNLSIEENKITAILGKSGSGKTTLLNIIANLTPFSGEIEGKEISTSFIFQKPRLVKNLTVEENLSLVCPEINASQALKSVGLEGCEKSYPKTLSEGMARRVSILRGFSFNANTLLMDEPFVNLDVAIKYSLLNTVKKMQEENPKTVIFVTHDIKEAISIADRILMIEDGKIIYDTNKINEKTEKEIFGLMIKDIKN